MEVGAVRRLPTGRLVPVAWLLPAAQIGWRLAGLAVCDTEGTGGGMGESPYPRAATRGTRESSVNIANGSLIGVISRSVRLREEEGAAAEAC